MWIAKMLMKFFSSSTDSCSTYHRIYCGMYVSWYFKVWSPKKTPNDSVTSQNSVVIIVLIALIVSFNFLASFWRQTLKSHGNSHSIVIYITMLPLRDLNSLIGIHFLFYTTVSCLPVGYLEN